MSELTPVDRPRYSTPPLPPYSYVPGRTPHPVSNPRGHMFGQAPQVSAALEPERWQLSSEYLYGIDLFNRGFYWEAHEAWESLWHAAGREGPVATWLKALIKLSAAAVKLREANAAGASRHVKRSLELVAEVQRGSSEETYCGVAINDVKEIAHAIAAEAEKGLAAAAPTRVLDQWLRLPI